MGSNAHIVSTSFSDNFIAQTRKIEHKDKMKHFPIYFNDFFQSVSRELGAWKRGYNFWGY